MDIKEITIGLTEEEFDTLGSALESFLKKEISRLKNKNDIDLLLDIEVNLLRQFSQMGYTMYIPINDKDNFGGELTHDVDEWIDSIFQSQLKKDVDIIEQFKKIS